MSSKSLILIIYFILLQNIVGYTIFYKMGLRKIETNKFERELIVRLPI